MKNSENLTVTPQGDREIVITRLFDAPRDLVFEAHTRPELLQRWFGVRSGWTLPVCQLDLKVGGAYRYVWRNGATGRDMGCGGVFLQVEPPQLLVYTESFDDYPGESTNTMVLADRKGQTLLTITSSYPSTEIRDMVLKSGMETGLAESYTALDNLLLTSEAKPVQ
jgi:uncharacterized protein YndB with AHSA1/START domain